MPTYTQWRKLKPHKFKIFSNALAYASAIISEEKMK